MKTIKIVLVLLVIVLSLVVIISSVNAECSPLSATICEREKPEPRDEIVIEVPPAEEIKDEEPVEEPEVTPEPVRSTRKTGSYIKITKPVYVWDVVKFGDRGENVKTLQMYLNNKGANLVVDGIYGFKTLKAFLEKVTI